MAELTEEQIFHAWEQADKDKSGSLSLKEIISLLPKLNLKLKDKQAKKIFKEVDVDKSGHLDYQEFRLFLSLLRSRPEVVQLYDMFYEIFHEDDEIVEFDSDADKYWTPQDFHRFLTEVQKEKDVDLATATRIIQEVEPKSKKHKEGDHLSSRGFLNYISNPKYNSLFNPAHNRVYQDMTQPLTHYFLASSHNTYLLGDQLKGESSVQAYINALKKGCKCVELDCWDGENKEEPIIYHGHTLTSKITFRDVIQTIKEYAFVVSDYPLILSLEVHCGLEGQAAMAKILKDILGDMLPPCPEDTGVLPPPEKLKKTVLIKGKRLPKSAQEPELPEEDLEEEEEAPEDVKSSQPAQKPEKKEKKKKEKTAKELSDITHLKTYGLTSFKENREKAPPSHAMCSFSENKVNKFIKNSATDLLEFNENQFSRIYPKGLRVDSSNYDPVPSWTCGSQIVALNYQTGSEPMWLNDGKFQDNGNAGWLLKPEYMRQKKISWEPEKPGSVKKTLSIKVISGWQLPKVQGKEGKNKGEVIDPYVKLSVHGVSKDQTSVKTRTVKNNGFNPVWNQTFKLPLTTPDLGIVMVTVMDEDLVTADDFIGQFALRLSNLREGYRVVPLKDKKGQSYEKASVLIQISIEDGDTSAIVPSEEKYEGELLKRGDSVFSSTKWNPRHFVVQNGELKYFQAKDNKKLKGCFSVKGIKFGPVKPMDKSFSYVFVVHGPQRTWFLRATAPKEFKKWKRHLLSEGALWEPKMAKEYTVSKEGKVTKVKN